MLFAEPALLKFLISLGGKRNGFEQVAFLVLCYQCLPLELF